MSDDDQQLTHSDIQKLLEPIDVSLDDYTPEQLQILNFVLENDAHTLDVFLSSCKSPPCLDFTDSLEIYEEKPKKNPIVQPLLLIAAERGSIDLFEVLVKHGATLTIETRNGSNALDWACYGGSLPMVKHLLSKYGEDIFSPYRANPLGYVPVGQAIFAGHTDIIHFFHTKFDLDRQTSQRTYLDTHPVQDAICRGNLATVRFMVENVHNGFPLKPDSKDFLSAFTSASPYPDIFTYLLIAFAPSGFHLPPTIFPTPEILTLIKQWKEQMNIVSLRLMCLRLIKVNHNPFGVKIPNNFPEMLLRWPIIFD
mmetsp:Transcript_9726/g.14660  ORF Transcript_9726/g.14660 Transcript_9726/m.14660 type:complete len:310 (+) Transcript_9726:51-980(+)